MTSTEIFLEYVAYRKRIAKHPQILPFTFEQYREFLQKEWGYAREQKTA